MLDVSRITALGLAARIGLREGITQTYAWFLADVLRFAGDSRR